MIDRIIERLKTEKLKNELDLTQMSPRVLAYIGDAVYELFIRSYLAASNNHNTNFLHKKASSFVRAEAQARLVQNLMHIFSEDELDIIRRGRNTKSGSMPKNADIIDYRYSTGFEALLGHMYISGQTDRLLDILFQAVDIIQN